MTVKNPLRALLNVAAWHTREISDLVLHVVCRGQPDDDLLVDGEDILEIRSDGIAVREPEGISDMSDGYWFIPCSAQSCGVDPETFWCRIRMARCPIG